MTMESQHGGFKGVINIILICPQYLCFAYIYVELQFLMNVPCDCSAAPFGAAIMEVLYSENEMWLLPLLKHGHN